MKRVAIIGNAGGGKSTLGKRLASSHNLPFISVDQIQWLPGWEQVDEDIVAERLDILQANERWVIDGWGPWPNIERRFVAADTIIFVDLPLWIHFWLAAERQISSAQGERRSDPLDGCDQLAITKQLFEMIWHVEKKLKPRLEALLENRPPDADYHHITTLSELDEFR